MCNHADSHSADRELQNQSSCLRDHSPWFLCTLQELTLSAGMPLSVWKCFSFYNSFLLHSFKAEWKIRSFSLCFWKIITLSLHQRWYCYFLKTVPCSWFEPKLNSLVSLYVIEYISLGQVKPIENGGLLGILNMHTLTLKLNCFSFSVPR